MKKLISTSVEETEKTGKKIALTSNPFDVICLFGPLGAGKTVIVRGICKGYKVKDFVNSPSFKIVNEYRGKFPVYHVAEALIVPLSYLKLVISLFRYC